MLNLKIPHNEEKRLLFFKSQLDELGSITEIVYKNPGMNVFDYACRMFQIISDYQDMSNFLGENDLPKMLNDAIFECGRSKKGHNRSNFLEKVTLNNTYWGGVFELDVKPASYWKKNKNIYLGFIEEWPQFYIKDPLETQVIVDMQLRHFCNYNYAKICNIIELLL